MISCGLCFDCQCICGNRRSHLENLELKAAYIRLQESYRELELMKDSLENTKAACQLNLTDAQKESEKTRTEVLCRNLFCATSDFSRQFYSRKSGFLNSLVPLGIVGIKF